MQGSETVWGPMSPGVWGAAKEPRATATGRTLSLIFEDLKAELQGPEGRSTGTRYQAEAAVAVGPKEWLLGYHAQVRGAVTCGLETRASLRVGLAGTVETREFPGALVLARAEDGQAPTLTTEFVLEVTAWEQYAPAQREPPGAPPPPLALTVELLVQRRGCDQPVMLVVDAVDVAALFSA